MILEVALKENLTAMPANDMVFIYNALRDYQMRYYMFLSIHI